MEVLLVVVQTCGWFIGQKLSRFCRCSFSRHPASLLYLYHILSVALKSPIIIAHGSVLSGVIISSPPSTLYTL